MMLQSTTTVAQNIYFPLSAAAQNLNLVVREVSRMAKVVNTSLSCRAKTRKAPGSDGVNGLPIRPR